MKKGSSESNRNSEKTTRRRRKYDEEFKQQALAIHGSSAFPQGMALRLAN